LEINWHDGQAIYSVDFSSDGTRMASAGADTSVRIESFPVHIEFLSELKRHSAPVNVVRFSPSGEYLASAGDDSCVILWRRSSTKESSFGRDYAEFEKENWTVVHMFYGHSKEVYDLAWSPCGQFFITASIDNTARVWSISTRNVIHVLTDHTHYVQGVAWDPKGQFVATQSSDRSVAIYKYRKEGPDRVRLSGCSKRHHRMNRQEDVTPFRMYHDENLVTFFRRLSFSPDGGFLVTPAGLCKNMETSTTVTAKSGDDDSDDLVNCAYVYPRNTLLRHPIACNSNHNKPSIAIRWCRLPYELRQKEKLFDLPYRMIYAVASQDAVYVYDTQQRMPLCVVSGMHFAPITDITWSHDGSILAFSSADGYCSAVVFEENELGPASQQQLLVDQDTEMMDISLPPEPVIKPAEKRAIATTTASPKKRRIAPTLISVSPSHQPLKQQQQHD
ncbi:WD40-repeat-containing domain protein, partial [Fennellomyces sp. T-0311]